MSISSQLPDFVAAVRSGALQALALQAGQMLDGKVIGPAPNGGTQVQISGQMLNLVLPLPAKAGEVLKFEVQGSGAQLRLALQLATPTGTPPPAASPTPLPAQATALPLPTTPASTATPVPTSLSPAATTQPAGAAQASQPALAPQSPSVALAQSTSAAPGAQTSAGTSQPTQALSPNSTPPVPAATQAVTTSLPSSPQVLTQAQPAAPSTSASAPPAQQTVPVLPYAPAPPRSAGSQAQPLAPAVPAVAPAAAAGASTQGMPQAAPQAGLPTAPPAMPSTPQAALAQMVQAALPRQGSVTSLTTALTSGIGIVTLPEPVVRAAQQLLAGRVAIDGGKLDAGALQKAVLGSGVFQEAALAKAGSSIPTPQADMKTGLLVLRQTLTNWLGQQAPLTQVAQIPPPLRGHVPRARNADAPLPNLEDVVPEEVGRHLLERTEAALSRIRLHQSASLPDPLAKTADWSMDVPVLIGQHQTLLHMQIHRDQHNEAEDAAERGWQMRFALNLPGMGEVGAQVSLRAGSTGVMLWAADRSTSEALEADISALRDTLAAVGLKPGAVIVRHGEPPAPPPAPSGHFVDAST